jgi:hypothetical protein
MSASLEGRSYLPPEIPEDRNCSFAYASLFFGVVGWIGLPLLSGILAIVLGHMARLKIARSEGRLTGDTLAVIGLALGYSNVVVVALSVLCIASLLLLPVVEKVLSR